MSEFQEKHEVSKFIGAPPGYAGHDDGGQLTNALKAQPSAVVLFDEVEKANAEILTILLQLFDEGRLTDGRGRTVKCKDAIFIMTSNLAADAITKQALKSGRKSSRSSASGQVLMSDDFKSKVIEPILKKHFKRDEFLGRIHETLYFVPFSNEELQELAIRELSRWSKRAQESHQLRVTWDESVVERMVSAYDIRFGARRIAQAVEQQVAAELAQAQAMGDIRSGQHVHLQVTEKSSKIIMVVTDDVETNGTPSKSRCSCWRPQCLRRTKRAFKRPPEISVTKDDFKFVANIVSNATKLTG